MKKALFSFMVLMSLVASGIYAEEQKKPWQIAYENDDPSFLNSLTKPVNYQDLNDRTQLHYAAEKGKYNIAKALIEKGADVNIKDNIDWTPLHHAAYRGQTKVAVLLIEHGADVNAKGGKSSTTGIKHLFTPLHYAAMRGHYEMLKLLVEHGAEVNAKNFEDESPLYMAVQHYESEVMVGYLVLKGANVNSICKDFDCPTPLFWWVVYTLTRSPKPITPALWSTFSPSSENPAETQ